MGKRFDVEYDDFTGGHFVGARQAGQPRNTWTGANVICTADEGFLMACPMWTPSNQLFSVAGTATLSPPLRAWVYNGTYRQDFGVVTGRGANLYSVDLTSGVVTALTALASNVSYEHNARFGTRLLFASQASAIQSYNASGGATTSHSFPTTGDGGVWTWGQFAVATGGTRERLYYSAAGDPTTWASGSYLTFGETGSSQVILSVIPTNDTLYVVTTDGWWAVTGVLGQTTVVRRVSHVAPGWRQGAAVGAVNSLIAAESTLGLLVANSAGFGQGLSALNGTQVRPVLHLASGKQIDYVVRSGYHVLAQQNNEALWIWSELHRRWRVMGLAATNGSGHTAYHQPTEDQEGSAFAANANPRLSVSSVYRDGTSSTTGYIGHTPAEPVQPEVTDGSSFDAAVATLAEYQSNSAPFVVKELLVEVDFGEPTNQTPSRVLSGAVITGARADVACAYGGALGTSTYTKTWTDATATVVGDREMVRFAVADGAETWSAAPKITMQGIKVRRVIMRCETVA